MGERAGDPPHHEKSWPPGTVFGTSVVGGPKNQTAEDVMKNLILAFVVVMGLSNTAMARTLKGGNCGGYVTGATKYLVEVKAKEGDAWKTLESWPWRPEAEMHVKRLQKGNEYHEVRLRTETVRTAKYLPRPRPKPTQYALEVKLNNDAMWTFMERAASSAKAMSRLAELEDTGYYFAVRARSTTKMGGGAARRKPTYSLEVKLSDDSGWKRIETSTTRSKAKARQAALEDSGYYFAVRAREVYQRSANSRPRAWNLPARSVKAVTSEP